MSDVAIVGAGPVGLFLALRLRQLGVRVVVFERRPSVHHDSRSIGIHPPSLACLRELGLARDFLAAGVRIERVIVFDRFGKALVRLPFDVHDDTREVLSLPQAETERILTEALLHRAPHALHYGACVNQAKMLSDGIRLTIHFSPDVIEEREFPFVVACDGRHSTLRRQLAFGYPGHTYPYKYIMSDVADATRLGSAVALFMHHEGLVESFPLPQGYRRWVVQNPEGASESSRAFCEDILRRTGHLLPLVDEAQLSVFRAERHCARRLIRGRVLLAGDAAHVVSPVGGQGMNLGWLGAWILGPTLAHAVELGHPTVALEMNSLRRVHLAHRIARRAEYNMWLGRPSHRPLRDRLLTLLLNSSLRAVATDFFTMRPLTSALSGRSAIRSPLEPRP